MGKQNYFQETDMKKIFILLLLAFLILFPACDSTSDGSETADAETEAAVNAVAGEAIMISYMGMAQEISPPVAGVSRGMARPTVSSTPVTGYGGVTISGSYDFTSASEFTADLDILFTDYSGSSGSLNGTVSIVIDGDFSVPNFSMTTSGLVTALYNGESYVMDFDFTIAISDTTISATGYIECNGYNVEFDYSESIPA
jgi:hypothetical protein